MIPLEFMKSLEAKKRASVSMGFFFFFFTNEDPMGKRSECLNGRNGRKGGCEEDVYFRVWSTISTGDAKQVFTWDVLSPVLAQLAKIASPALRRH